MKEKTFLTLLTALLVGGSSCARGQQPADDADTFTTRSGKTIKITPIKHASMEISYNGLEFEIDPVVNAVEPITDYSRKAKADFILVTHEHHDHFDPSAIKALTKKGTRLILNQRCHDLIQDGEIMANGDSLQLADDIRLYAVAAYNTTAGHLQFHPKGRDNGFILELDGTRIYIAGDTEVIPEMKNLGPVDIAFMPCNQPYTMTPAQLHEAAAIVRPRVLYPYHFSRTPREDMEKATAGMGIDVRMRNFQ